MVAEVLEGLALRSGATVVDATVGGGGHAEQILEATGPDGMLIGFDRDPRAVDAARERLTRFGTRARIIHASYAQIHRVLEAEKVGLVDGILADVGLSSDQLDASGRGFSFKDKGALDMRFDTTSGESASDLLMTAPRAHLERILRNYGEVSAARAIVDQIVHLRERAKERGETVIDVPSLVSMILAIVPQRRGHIHPATTIFQALRIAVNDELSAISTFLPIAINHLAPHGRLVFISYHSLEDRLVKDYCKLESRECICPPTIPVCRCLHHARVRLITKKPISPQSTEIAANPRSRSAKLRVVEKI